MRLGRSLSTCPKCNRKNVLRRAPFKEEREERARAQVDQAFHLFICSAQECGEKIWIMPHWAAEDYNERQWRQARDRAARPPGEAQEVSKAPLWRRLVDWLKKEIGDLLGFNTPGGAESGNGRIANDSKIGK